MAKTNVPIRTETHSTRCVKKYRKWVCVRHDLVTIESVVCVLQVSLHDVTLPVSLQYVVVTNIEYRYCLFWDIVTMSWIIKQSQTPPIRLSSFYLHKYPDLYTKILLVELHQVDICLVIPQQPKFCFKVFKFLPQVVLRSHGISEFSIGKLGNRVKNCFSFRHWEYNW